MRKLLPVLIFIAALISIGSVTAGATGQQPAVGKVRVPLADRFEPYVLTIHVGDTVRWTNYDADDHTVVSDDAFNTAGHQGTNQLLPTGGTFVLSFDHPGTFVYYCRFHAHLNDRNQPIAPGPDGGIQNASGNFGTPMSGVIVVLPSG